MIGKRRLTQQLLTNSRLLMRRRLPWKPTSQKMLISLLSFLVAVIVTHKTSIQIFGNALQNLMK
ncbi:hypothetical protein J6590_005424 [Homalodisca vitripennis]|nr:hypothetical protein J6590_005424 [Homalodisca vitripennis]